MIKNFSLILIIIFSLNACSEDPEPSLYDPSFNGAPAPEITSVNPPAAEGALAGVTNIEILGKNFSSELGNNLVSFGGNIADVLEASTSRLLVKAPNVVNDSLQLKIAVSGALEFSNSIVYKLKPAVDEFYPFKDFEIPYAITTDADSNLYVSLVSSNSGQGIKKITPAGVLTDWAPKGGETFWQAIKMGASNTIYGVRSVRAVFQITEGAAPATFAVLPTGVTLVDLDIDNDGNIWTGGDNDAIYRITPAKEYKAFPFGANVKSIRIFDGGIYCAAIKDSAYSIFKFQIINSDSLGAEEVYFDIPDEFLQGEFKISAITFSADGDLFIGTNLPEPVIQVHPDKSYEYFYPGLITPNVFRFAWGPGNILYYTRETDGNNSQTVIYIDTERSGAPYYGRD